MAKKQKDQKSILANVLMDTLEVALYGGIPATGVVALIALLSEDVPTIAKYGSYLGVFVNMVIFAVKRYIAYFRGDKELKFEV